MIFLSKNIRYQKTSDIKLQVKNIKFDVITSSLGTISYKLFGVWNNMQIVWNNVMQIVWTLRPKTYRQPNKVNV